MLVETIWIIQKKKTTMHFETIKAIFPMNELVLDFAKKNQCANIFF